MTDQTNESKAIGEKIRQMLEQRQTCMLATLSSSKADIGFIPEASQTPFIYHEGSLYIFISALSSHTQNLKEHARCSALVSEDEGSAKNVFALQRLSLKGCASFISQDDPSYCEMLNTMESELGNTIGLLRSLPDFSLVKISIESGTYIEGFGKAYRFNGTDFNTAEQLTGK